MTKILVFAGTRPEAVKMAPVYTALKEKSRFDVRLVAIGQHRELLRQTLADFSLTPDIDLNLMRPDQTLAGLSARLFKAVEALLAAEEPAAVLVQGDTTTAQVSALCAFYGKIPVGHVEAGLRSHNLHAPFPEELNRRVVALAARWHFAPTEAARLNLLQEGVEEKAILVTGNTVIDSLLQTRELVLRAPPPLPGAVEEALQAGRPLILVTGHRRENFGEGLKNICLALLNIARDFPETRIVYPVHLNPNVRAEVIRALENNSGIILEEPLSYRPFIRLMNACALILTDSGGLQEEGPALGKPVLVLREVTERPEAVEAGVARLVGTKVESIRKAVRELLVDPAAYSAMAGGKNPFGDGGAGARIAEFLASTPELR
jgi:UDP-N-acetylglucosamine 2-epimerase